MGIFKNWTGDIPQQFQGKKKISVLIRAFSRQMDEVMQVLSDLETKTSIEMADGQNLDYTGSIATMSRKDAHIVLRKNHNVEITDDVYRKVLLWKLIKNTSDCTYEDIMDSMSILWNTDNISYVENPARPATIFLKILITSLDSADPGTERVLSIKPAGVAVIYSINYYTVIIMYGLEVIDVTRIIMRIVICFWGCAILNGTKLLNGSHLVNAKKRYRLVLRVKNDIKLYINKNMDMDRAYINILSCFNVHEKICGINTLLRLDGFNFWNIVSSIIGNHNMPLKITVPVYTDTTQGIDVSRLVNGGIKTYIEEKTGVAVAVKAAVNFLHGCHQITDGTGTVIKNRHIAAVKTSETIENITITCRRNLHYLNGSKRLDGTRLVNAFYGKESI